MRIATTGERLGRRRYYFKGKEKMMAFGECPLVSPRDARPPFRSLKTLAADIDPMAEHKAESETKKLCRIHSSRAQNFGQSRWIHRLVHEARPANTSQSILIGI